jgi:pentatricopeptide repeat domain-containing protein 1
VSAGIQQNVITYSSANGACEEGGQSQRALDVLPRCVSAVIKPDVITYNSAICACEEGGEWQRVSD